MLTPMALVPVLALLSALARGFGVQQVLHDVVVKQAAEFSKNFDPALATDINDRIGAVFGFLERTNFTTLGGLGFLVLLYAAIGLLSRIEAAFNATWSVERGRAFVRRYSDYIGMLILVPLLILVATSLTTVQRGAAFMDELPQWLHWIYSRGIGLLPLLLIWVAFTALYKVMPNTKVLWPPAMWGGLVAAVLWVATQWTYITFQVGVARFNAIYGTFAALPLLMVYMHLSFSILIVGAEVSQAVQNANVLRFGRGEPMRSFGLRRRLGVIVVHEVCERFRRGRPPWTPDDGHELLDLPIEWLAEVADDLVGAGLLIRAAENGGEGGGFVPARSPELIDAAAVYQAVLRDESWHRGKELVPSELAERLRRVDETVEGLLAEIRFAPATEVRP
jgi:membrane protein